MDLFAIIIIAFTVFILFSLCGMCCKKRRDQGAVLATPVVITSTQHHVGPYPVQQQHHAVLTQSAAAPVGSGVGGGVVMQQHTSGTGVYPMPGYNAAPYPPQQNQSHLPYPTTNTMPMPMPAVPAPMMDSSAPPAQAMMNPPSYESVVTENYAKQAPYNPHFTG